MNITDGLTLIISLVALWVSIRTNRQNYKLQVHQSELAKIQSEMLKNQFSKASCLVEMIRGNGNKYEFKISNVSQVDATNVDIKFHLKEAQSTVRENKKYQDLFPVKILSPSQSVSIYSRRDHRSPKDYQVSLTWINPDGSSASKDTTLIP